MREASPFGEVKDMLISGWNKMGVPELQKSIEESLSIKEAETSIVEARGIKKLGLMLSIFFGISDKSKSLTLSKKDVSRESLPVSSSNSTITFLPFSQVKESISFLSLNNSIIHCFTSEEISETLSTVTFHAVVIFSTILESSSF
jgi:hypothetical protein